jgi:predicted RecA/RadA family phage recombinase
VKNQLFTGTPTSRRFALCPTTVKAGDPVLLGSEPAVALDDYSPLTGGTTFLMGGTFNLNVLGSTAASPVSGHVLKQGDKVYYEGGVLDSATNVTTGGTLDAASASPLFGYIDPGDLATVGSTLTVNIGVRLAGAE